MGRDERFERLDEWSFSKVSWTNWVSIRKSYWWGWSRPKARAKFKIDLEDCLTYSEDKKDPKQE